MLSSESKHHCEAENQTEELVRRAGQGDDDARQRC